MTDESEEEEGEFDPDYDHPSVWTQGLVIPTQSEYGSRTSVRFIDLFWAIFHCWIVHNDLMILIDKVLAN